jgi:hypothetical protein
LGTGNESTCNFQYIFKQSMGIIKLSKEKLKLITTGNTQFPGRIPREERAIPARIDAGNYEPGKTHSHGNNHGPVFAL